jgi:hypothetical protein
MTEEREYPVLAINVKSCDPGQFTSISPEGEIIPPTEAEA